ncbi:hypothetical protein [Moorena sp. SIO3H5]|uniref:hypothetical protein n=1 Tax=Moorena sp. SIO3H5 TaxID=2607834 RepID=UPI0013B60537|nr:hypothetical protein [Moorena sp. SIO3H5]NEO74517.1 hypothetical protein [Moorena sp. SIO3H5]
MQRGLGGFHGAYKVRTQVPHTAPPHERLHQDRVLMPWRPGIVEVILKLSAISYQLSPISLWVRSQAGSLCHKADH